MRFGKIAFVCLSVSLIAGALSPNFAEKALQKLEVTGVEVSSTQTGDIPNNESVIARNMIDGIPSTRWSSAFADNQWVVFQLKKKADIKKVTIKWEAANAKSISISVSNDNKRWKQVFATDNAPGGTEEIQLDNAKGKFVKLDLIKRATEWGFSIIDVDFMGY